MSRKKNILLASTCIVLGMALAGPAAHAAEEILTAVCPGMQLEFLETTEVAYRCYCSRERVVGALISLGRKELEEIAQAGQTVHIGCQFCDADYRFQPEEIRELLSKI